MQHKKTHSHSPTTTPAAPPRRRNGLLLLVLLVAQLMVILDITAVNIALPSLAKDLQLSGSQISWTITSYSLVFGSLLLFGGRAADLLGRRRLFLTGLGVFTAVVARLRPRRHGRCAVRGAGRPGSRSRHALPGRAVDHHELLPRPREGEGARRLGRRRRRGCGDRRPRRRAPDRVRRLADDLLREPPCRVRTRGRGTEDRSGRRRASRACADWICAARSSQRPAWARSSTPSRRAQAPAGRPPRRSASRSPASRASLRSPSSRRTPSSRCSRSGGSPIVPSAAGSS